MKLPFTKMHGLGNDFVVFDFTQNSYPLSSEQAAAIADRHLGVGCDQILIVETSEREGIDFKYRIINADGSEVGQCGNGARCFAKYVYDKGLSSNNPLKVETLGGDLTIENNAKTDLITVEIGVPKFAPKDIPLLEDEEAEYYSINKDGDAIRFYALSLGNPHAVIQVEHADHAPVDLVGPMLESHPIFPERTNVGFMEIIERDQISLRVFERGTGETLACGSGACAAVVAGIKAGLLDEAVSVKLRGGELDISWAGGQNPVMMTGTATSVFTGEIDLESLQS